MELLKEITENDVGLKTHKAGSYRLRRSSRAIVLSREGKVALMYSPRDRCFWTPGGGIDEGESVEEALRREVLEETGCRVRIDCGVGVSIAYIDSLGVIGISYCFLAHAVGKPRKLKLTEFEVSAGTMPVWKKDIDDAMKAVAGSQNHSRWAWARFAKKSDLAFLEKARSILEQKHGRRAE